MNSILLHTNQSVIMTLTDCNYLPNFLFICDNWNLVSDFVNSLFSVIRPSGNVFWCFLFSDWYAVLSVVRCCAFYYFDWH